MDLKFKDGATMNLAITLDACIDGTAETGTMKGNVAITGNAALAQPPGGGTTLAIRVESTTRR